MFWLVLVMSTGVPAPEAPDLDHLLAEARRVERSDLEFWGTLAFDRTVERDRLDAEKRVVSRETLEFRLTPLGGGRFDERLRRIDGRSPTEGEIRRHRRAARFTERYLAVLSGNDDTEYGGLSGLLDRSGYSYRGTDAVGGRRCHRLHLAPDDDSSERGRAARLWASTEGTLWLDAERFHIVRAETRTVRSIPVLFGLGRVDRVEVRVDTAPVEGRWLPRTIEVRTEVRVAGHPFRRNSVFRYANHAVHR